MQVKMLQQQDLSFNDGLTTQTLQAGQIYDVPEAIALQWIGGGLAASTGPQIAEASLPEPSSPELSAGEEE